jgi:hypothetical protein
MSRTAISSINTTDCHDIAELLLKVTLSTITLTLTLAMSEIRTHNDTNIIRHVNLIGHQYTNRYH